MIKTGGENVSGRDVEEAIYSLPGIAEVAVIGIPHPKWIEAVVAVVVLKQGMELSENDIIDHCAEQLAAFKVPKRILFTAHLPRNPSGKILKRDLREAFRAVFSDVTARV